MKNLDYYRHLNFKVIDETSHLLLTQQEISGGRITKEDIDIIKRFPDATEISISGLTQETFEYFIVSYGAQFKAINFWKCPLVNDLKKIEHLHEVEYIVYFWNQRAENLWDFSKTKSLKGFSFDDFTQMPDISQISKSPTLEELNFGNKVWSTYILNTLEPLRDCTNLRNLTFSAKKILDNKIEPIASLTHLEKLEFPSNLFSTEQVAWLKAHLPASINSKVLNPCWKNNNPITANGKNKDTVIVGKRKPLLDSVQDKKRIEKYVKKFNVMYDWYSENETAIPEDYNAA